MRRKPLIAGVRAIAIIEAAKGALVLLAGLGLLSLVHRNVQAVADQIVRLSHLDPASRYPLIFIDLATHLNDARLWLLAVAALLYSVIRGVEAYGLWNARRWAGWLALVSTGIYLPAEIYQIGHHPSWISSCLLAVNAVIVAATACALLRPSGQDPASPAANPTPALPCADAAGQDLAGLPLSTPRLRCFANEYSPFARPHHSRRNQRMPR